MDANTWQTIKEILALFLAPLVASIPGILALRENRKKTIAEAKKLESESEDAEASAGDKVAKAALEMIKHHEEDTQRLRLMTQNYENTIEELRTDFTGCKEQMARLSAEMSTILEENAKLVRSNTELANEVKVLKDTVKVLATQLQSLGIEPLFGKRAEDSKLVENGG